jgi:succinate dehydrogenase/fumarate reductase flavoprotein subunit
MLIEKFLEIVSEQIEAKFDLGRKFLSNLTEKGNIFEIRHQIGERMDRKGAMIRSIEGAHSGAQEAKDALKRLPEVTRISSIDELPYAYQNYDLLLTQYVYLSAIANYIEKGGKSRGSYLVHNPNGEIPLPNLPELFRFSLDDGRLSKMVQEVYYENGECYFEWSPVKPIPKGDDWFENVWNDYRRGEIFRKG